MKKIASFTIVLFLVLLISGCGGGGSGSSGGITYSGKTTKAVLNEDNLQALSLVALGLEFAPDALAESPLNLSGSPRKVLARAFSSKRALFRSLAAAGTPVPVNETIYGEESGYVICRGELYEDGTGYLVFRYENFNDGDGQTIDGTVMLDVLEYSFDFEEITRMSFEMSPLRFSTGDGSLTLDGTISSVLKLPENRETLVINVDGLDGNTGEMARFENYEIETLYAEARREESSAGRFYLSSLGYVDVSTASPLVYSYPGSFNVDVPDGGGPLTIYGENGSSIRITPISLIGARIQLDEDGDGTNELDGTAEWKDFAGLIITFEKDFGTPLNDFGTDAIETSDGGYAIAGYTNTESGNLIDCYLARTNAAGDVVWEKKYGSAGDDYFEGLVETGDGGFFLAGSSKAFEEFGSHIYALRTDSSGEVLWEKRWSGDLYSRATAIASSGDGGFVVTGTIESYGYVSGMVGFGMEDVYLAKIDGDGDILWEKRYGGQGTDIPLSIARTSGGGYLIAGSSDFGTNMYLLLTDAEGNKVWENNYGGDLGKWGSQAVEDPEGNFIMAGNAATLNSGTLPTILKIDPSGNIVFEKTWAVFPDGLATLSGIAPSPGGGYILTGDGSMFLQLVKIDSSGEKLWEREYGWRSPGSIKATSDGGYLIGGTAWPPAWDADLYLIKTDSEGFAWSNY